MQISIERFDPATSAHVLSFIRYFRDVYAAPPWGELLRCRNPDCGRKYGPADIGDLQSRDMMCCEQFVDDFWPAHKILALFRRFGPESSAFVCVVDDVVVGSCAGFPLRADELDSYLEFPGIFDSIAQAFPTEDRFAYQCDLGLLPQFRLPAFPERHLAAELQNRRHEDFLAKGLKVAVVRTQSSPPTQVFKHYPSYGFRIHGSYTSLNANDHRVIMARALAGLTYPDRAAKNPR